MDWMDYVTVGFDRDGGSRGTNEDDIYALPRKINPNIERHKATKTSFCKQLRAV
jgi:hypothetical protein